MEEQAELIQQEMEATREDLGEKVQALQDKVTGDVAAATESVTETVETVSEGVQGTMESVRQALDFPSHVRAHPWLMVGGAVIVGYLAHELLARSRYAETEEYFGPPEPGHEAPAPAARGGTFSRMFGRSWDNLQRVAAQTALELAGQGARQFLPGDLGASVGQVVEDMKADLRADTASGPAQEQS